MPRDHGRRDNEIMRIEDMPAEMTIHEAATALGVLSPRIKAGLEKIGARPRKMGRDWVFTKADCIQAWRITSKEQQ